MLSIDPRFASEQRIAFFNPCAHSLPRVSREVPILAARRLDLFGCRILRDLCICLCGESGTRPVARKPIGVPRGRAWYDKHHHKVKFGRDALDLKVAFHCSLSSFSSSLGGPVSICRRYDQ
mmetsp:Transcript_37650/g.78893  ORF Transcript_37650/g.78893 Transcript_37650/m.78893 type:complete len:121 (+) Transcript_37650:282-644(+)